MSQPYGYVVEQSAAEFLLRLDESEALYLAATFRWLAARPHTPGAEEHHDHTGRVLQAHLVGSFTVVVWADHAVRELRVVEIYPD